MTTITAIPTTHSCLVQPSRKRKRTSGLHVSFCTRPQNIIYTYSQSDYDRSGLVPDMESQQQYIVALLFQQQQDTKEPVNKPPMKPKINKRPKLSIDTSNLSGPLYFTNMTTNHYKKPIPQQQQEEPEDGMDILTKENTRRNSLPLIIC